MPRHSSLVPLSHDHHHGLVVALRLKKGGPASQNDWWLAGEENQAPQLLAFADSELLHHFTLEEQLVFPVLLDLGDDMMTSITGELLAEHQAMRASLEKIRQLPDPQMLKDFGDLLEAHIRKEERILFPLVEQQIEKGGIILDDELIKTRHDSYAAPPVC